jgi:hypothetical protein
VRLCYIKHPWRTEIVYATGITGGTGLRQGRQQPEAYKALYATDMTCIRGVQWCCTPRIGLVGPKGTRTNSIGGVQDSYTPRIWHYPWRTEILYASDAVPRPAQTHPTSLACVLSVRHGYVHSRGIHFSCTPLLHSRGVQNFVYASDEHSSYDLFPSSETLTRTDRSRLNMISGLSHFIL